MNIILNNPFRILGLPVTASEREITKRIADLEIYAEMGKSKHFDTDFSFLSSFQRTPETIREASNQIEQPKNRLFYSLFWFWCNNSTDDLVFDLLRDGKINKSNMIWKKSINKKSITEKNYSAARNLSVLYLGLAAKNGELRQNALLNGLYLINKLFTDNLFNEYSHIIVGSTFQSNKEIFIKSFVEEVLKFAKPYLDIEKGIATQKLLGAFELFPADIRIHATDNFVSEPLHNIETDIASSTTKRTHDAQNAHHFGEKLYNSTQDDLTYLKSVLSESNIQYQMIADKVAEEILQCSIDYYNKLRDYGDFDPGEDALRLAEYASSISVGERVITRIHETISIYDKWIKDSSRRDRQKQLQPFFDHIKDQIENLPDADILSPSQVSRLPDIAQNFVDNCRRSLDSIKSYLGGEDDLYLDISSSVASSALSMCIEYSNRTHEYAKPLRVLKNLGALDMVPELRSSYQENNKILENNQKFFEREKVEEELHKKIEAHIDYIQKQIQSLPDPNTISFDSAFNLPDIAQRLIDNCSNSLLNIKNALGDQDDFYLNISGAVANNAMGLCIEHANSTSEYSNVITIMERIVIIDMAPELRERYNQNMNILRKNKQLQDSSRKTSGCYIATMVYGDYNAPEVLIFRNFRDNLLSKYVLGRLLINVYYRYSPILVAHCRQSKKITKMIRLFLSLIAKVLTS